VTMRITEYLGKHISTLLEDAPFKHWPVEKYIEEDLEEKRTYYTFKEHGIEVCCDQNDKISDIFLKSEENKRFDESLFEIPFSLSRNQVLERFGTPSKSSGKSSSAFLGDSGAWDIFTQQTYAIHIEYRVDSDRIKMITLMRNDIIP